MVCEVKNLFKLQSLILIKSGHEVIDDFSIGNLKSSCVQVTKIFSSLQSLKNRYNLEGSIYRTVP